MANTWVKFVVGAFLLLIFGLSTIGSALALDVPADLTFGGVNQDRNLEISKDIKIKNDGTSVLNNIVITNNQKSAVIKAIEKQVQHLGFQLFIKINHDISTEYNIVFTFCPIVDEVMFLVGYMLLVLTFDRSITVFKIKEIVHLSIRKVLQEWFHVLF